VFHCQWTFNRFFFFFFFFFLTPSFRILEMDGATMSTAAEMAAPAPITANVATPPSTTASQRARPHRPGIDNFPRTTKFVAGVINKSLPFIILGLVGYAIYVYCFLYCWTEVVSFHSRRVGIALICAFCAILTLLFVTWAQVLVVGPGRYRPDEAAAADAGEAADTGRVMEKQAALREVFVCDPYGYPLWCSTCQMQKPDRVHHSAELGYCVPKMDHLCNWVGGVIGLANYRFFMQFLGYFILLLSFLVVSMAVFTSTYKARTGTQPAHLIVIFVISGFWLVLLVAFTAVHISYVLTNTTTIESMRYKQSDFPIFNFRETAQSNLRVVSRMRRTDPRPYSLGSAANWRGVMGSSALYWVFPLPLPRAERARPFAEFNPALLALFRDRYARREEGYPAVRVPPSQQRAE
jgi:palmitoyltransferase